MKYILTFLIATFSITTLMAKTQFSIVKTGYADSFDVLSRESGEFKKLRFNHSAFVIKHDSKVLIFETGIGENIDEEFKHNMPFWAKPFFDYTFTKSLKSQIGDLKIDAIYLSHAHWDHAGGLTDDLGQRPTISVEEFRELDKGTLVKHRTFPIHFKNNTPKSFKWKNKKYLEFDKYYDPYGDGKIIFVPLPGHSFGSIGLIINGINKKFFFVGDSIWVEKQLDRVNHKFYISSTLVDRNKEVLTETLKKIKIMRDKYGYYIIPTHDSEAQDKLKYFPKWNIVE